MNAIPPNGFVPDATVTVLCQNEARHIGACLASIARAGRGLTLATDVIVNGSTDGSATAALQASEALGLATRVFTIAHGDKANAINQAMRRQAEGGLRRPARLHVFADAYATIAETALRAFGDTLADDAYPSAVTGIALNGRTMAAAAADTLNQGGRLNGQLHAFRPAFLDRMAAAGIKLAVGLYRGDSLLASMLCHDLDAPGSTWDNRRVVAAPAALFEIPQLAPWRPRDIARQFRRKIRQMRGLLENEAVKSFIYPHGFAALPDNADDMIASWLAGGGRVDVASADRPFLALARRRHARAKRPLAADLAPCQVFR